MRHTPIAQSMGEGHGGLFEIIYLADNRAQTPVVIVENISHKWAVRLVEAYNTQPDLLVALAALEQIKSVGGIQRGNLTSKGIRCAEIAAAAIELVGP